MYGKSSHGIHLHPHSTWMAARVWYNLDMMDNFLNTLLPGNYFLTKSMEISKVSTSGTLWYMKKFLVYYYYIFLSKNINSLSDTAKIRENFDKFIDSLPENNRDSAKISSTQSMT